MEEALFKRIRLKRKTIMSVTETIDLRTLLDTPDSHAQLEIIRVGRDDTPVVPFTLEGIRIWVHYCEELEIKGYVACAGASGCLLCKAGRAADERLLLPVFGPISGRVGVLMISASMRPKALLPQILFHVKKAEDAGGRAVLFIKRLSDNSSFLVEGRPLEEGEDDGAAAVKRFRDDFSAGRVDLKSVVQHLSGDQLKAVAPIARRLALKGVV